MSIRLHNNPEVRAYLEKEHRDWLRALTPRHINPPPDWRTSWLRDICARSRAILSCGVGGLGAEISGELLGVPLSLGFPARANLLPGCGVVVALVSFRNDRAIFPEETGDRICGQSYDRHRKIVSLLPESPMETVVAFE